MNIVVHYHGIYMNIVEALSWYLYEYSCGTYHGIYMNIVEALSWYLYEYSCGTIMLSI